MKNPTQPFISVQELAEIFPKLSSKEKIFDVRTAEEFAEGFIPGSTNKPFDQILEVADVIKSVDKAYLICRSGGRVQAAMSALASAGITNVIGIVGGGVPDWIEAGYPSRK